MSTLHVGHNDIVTYADNYVNIKREDVKDFRDQVNRLRDRLEAYIQEHPDFGLKKMLLSGSLAKGTALKSIDDIDVAVYVSEGEAPSDINKLIPWLAERLRKTYPNFRSDQIVENLYTVTILYVTSGLKVDIVPVFYNGDADWKGYLVSKNSGDKILTSIPQHLKFIQKRKNANVIHFAQIVRLMKQWRKHAKSQNPDFRFKSFMMELTLAHLADNGLKMDNYPEALAEIFAFIATDQFKTAIAFSDYYDPSTITSTSDPMQIWDPVNPENNTAMRYNELKRDAIIDAALDAGDAIDSALRATTKQDTVRYWQKVFGTTFNP